LAEVDTLRDRLKSLAIAPGQRIAFRCADGIDYVVGSLALLTTGAAVVPVPDSVTADEVRETLDRIDVQGLLAHVRFADSSDTPNAGTDSTDNPRRDDARVAVHNDDATAEATQASQRDNSLTPPTSEASTVPVDPTFVWQPRRAAGTLDERCRALHAAFIRFSSGTTGESKGVVLSHESIAARTAAANAGLGVTSDDVILWVLGMSHHFVVSILLFLRKGATIIVANQGFPFSVLEAAKNFPITLIYGSPVHYYLLGVSDLVPPDALRHVRLAISTSMKIPPDVAAAFTHKFGFAPAEAYGIIEIGLPFINTDAGGAGKNTVGRALPAYELQIARPDDHGVGEVLIRGQGMFDAYVSPWRLRADCTDDGWFHTGDLGKLDDAGRLCLLGRSKTVIVCAGMKVFPEEVEAAINAIPGVRESLVWGRDHAQFGQVPVASVVLSDPESDVLDSLRGHCIEHLSSYKVPVEFIAVDALPKTPSGKLARATFNS
jgi:long-chain acyl-CoA synthetase